MAQILPENPSFASQFARNLASGLSQGIGQGSQLINQALLQRQQQQARQNLLRQIEGTPEPFPSQFADQIGNVIDQYESQIGKKLSPEQREMVGDKLKQLGFPEGQYAEDDFAKARKYAELGEHDLSRVASEEAKIKEKRRMSREAGHEEIAKLGLKSAAERAEALPQKEVALENMIDSIANKDMSFWTLDNLAEITGIEGLRSPESAAFKTSAKEFFLGGIKRAGGRPNQWVEQQILDMLPKIGRSQEANLVVTEALKTELDLEKKQIELTNEIADQMERKYGYVRRDLTEQVRKKMAPYAMEKQKELQQQMKDIKERYQPKTKEGMLMYDPAGNLRRVSSADLKEARKAGYRDYK